MHDHFATNLISYPHTDRAELESEVKPYVDASNRIDYDPTVLPLAYFLNIRDYYVEHYLFPTTPFSADNIHPDIDEISRIGTITIFGFWDTLQSVIFETAYKLWHESDAYTRLKERQTDLAPKTVQDNHDFLQFAAQQAVRLLMLAVDVGLLKARANQNFAYDENEASLKEQPKEHQEKPVRALHKLLYLRSRKKKKEGERSQHKKPFRSILADWNRESRKDLGYRLFSQVHLATHLRTLLHDFSLDRLDVHERGWREHATKVNGELGFRWRAQQQREAAWRTPFLWLWLTLLRFSNGYGYRRWQFAVTGILVVLVVAGAFFIDDLMATPTPALPQCHIAHTGFGIAQDLLLRLYSAVVTVTELGGNPPSCGAGGPWITAFAAIAGYFLLAVLAALIINQLPHLDRPE